MEKLAVVYGVASHNRELMTWFSFQLTIDALQPKLLRRKQLIIYNSEKSQLLEILHNVLARFIGEIHLHFL